MITVVRTIGYEGALATDFLATLQEAGVTALVDIRELPISRRKGFSKKALEASLKQHGIKYQHLKSLGDPKAGREAARRGAYDEFRQIFGSHLQTKAAQEGLSLLAKVASSESVCLLCYERDPNQCHRSLVASALSDILTLNVQHLGVRDGIAGQQTSRTRESFNSRKSAPA